MKPTLFLLAAGMGSRYGGLKQLDTLGPQGQSIMDYSIYDAIQAGFGKIVWVIRRDFEQQFREQILSKYEGHVPCELCFQALDALPEGFTVPEGRTKPWGTNHAEMMWLTTMNPASRRLIRVMPEEAARTAEVFDLLLGDNLAGRKEHIAQHGAEYLDDLDLS